MKLNGAILKDARDRKGLTQDDVSEATGLSIPTIVRAEKGEGIFTSTGRSLCDFLGLDLASVVVPRHQEDDDAA
jgi:transcriptional regulator with XRE-family HTH domain